MIWRSWLCALAAPAGDQRGWSERTADRLPFAARGATLEPARVVLLNAQFLDIDPLLLDARGLPGRPWYRKLIAAPGRSTGCTAKTLPGVREAIEERRFAEAALYVERTPAVLSADAARLEAARRTFDGAAPLR